MKILTLFVIQREEEVLANRYCAGAHELLATLDTDSFDGFGELVRAARSPFEVGGCACGERHQCDCDYDLGHHFC